jgi:tRNA(fMet)-specific endonuclease VapC
VLILDTDTLTILQNVNSPLYGRLIERLRQDRETDVYAPVVSFQEQAAGWIASVNRARTPQKLLFAYKSLKDLIHDYSSYAIVPFDAAAQATFESLRPQLRRLGTMDLRIASITLARGATLLTRNLRDFRQVPGLNVEDWSR